MTKLLYLAAAVAIAVAGCHPVISCTKLPGRALRQPQTAPAAVPVRVYVSNERSGDVSVIDPSSRTVVATIPVGKRPRGLLVSRDLRTLYVALSGSPIAGPNV